MEYPINLLKEELREQKKASQHCLNTGSLEDYHFINDKRIEPLKKAIWLVESSMEYDLRFNKNE